MEKLGLRAHTNVKGYLEHAEHDEEDEHVPEHDRVVTHLETVRVEWRHYTAEVKHARNHSIKPGLPQEEQTDGKKEQHRLADQATALLRHLVCERDD